MADFIYFLNKKEEKKDFSFSLPFYSLCNITKFCIFVDCINKNSIYYELINYLIFSYSENQLINILSENVVLTVHIKDYSDIVDKVKTF